MIIYESIHLVGNKPGRFCLAEEGGARGVHKTAPSFGGSFSPHRGVVFCVPRRVCGACPSRPGRWCQAERGWTTAACDPA